MKLIFVTNEKGKGKVKENKFISNIHEFLHRETGRILILSL